MKKPPKILNRIVDKILAYKPKKKEEHGDGWKITKPKRQG